jgi:hypothetical protein
MFWLKAIQVMKFSKNECRWFLNLTMGIPFFTSARTLMKGFY